MASAIFICPMTDSGPQFYVESGQEDVPGLNYMELIQDGTDGYGFSVIGQVPQAGTCLVRVWASDDALDALMADENYEFVEDVDGEGN